MRDKRLYCTKKLSNVYENKNWEEILEDFQGKINFNLMKVPAHERDDLEQEIKLKVIEKLNYLLENDKTIGFWEFIEKEIR